MRNRRDVERLPRPQFEDPAVVEGGKRTQYVLLNARDRGEVEVVRDADTRLREALAAGRLELPAGATYRWVGRYEQKLKAKQMARLMGLNQVAEAL